MGNSARTLCKRSLTEASCKLPGSLKRVGDIFRVSGRVIGTVSRGKIYPVVTEADFYSAEEAAKALGIPVRRVFGMLCGGELEGTQDEWARWRVPASAVQRARHNPE